MAGREPPPKRTGPGAVATVRAEREAARMVRGYARAVFAELRAAVRSVPIDAPKRERQVGRALRAARGKIRRQWPKRDLERLLREIYETGRKSAKVQARALIRGERSDAEQLSLPGPARRMANRAELPKVQALAQVDDVLSRVRLTGSGRGLTALRELQSRAAAWVIDATGRAATNAELEVGFDVAIRKVLGRADLIGSEESARASAQAVRAALLDVGTGYYRWKTQLDNRVRDEHKALEGAVLDWEQGSGLADGRHPGDAINCRCWPEPVTRDELIREGLLESPVE